MGSCYLWQLLSCSSYKLTSHDFTPNENAHKQGIKSFLGLNHLVHSSSIHSRCWSQSSIKIVAHVHSACPRKWWNRPSYLVSKKKILLIFSYFLHARLYFPQTNLFVQYNTHISFNDGRSHSFENKNNNKNKPNIVIAFRGFHKVAALQNGTHNTLISLLTTFPCLQRKKQSWHLPVSHRNRDRHFGTHLYRRSCRSGTRCVHFWWLHNTVSSHFLYTCWGFCIYRNLASNVNLD